MTVHIVLDQTSFGCQTLSWTSDLWNGVYLFPPPAPPPWQCARASWTPLLGSSFQILSVTVRAHCLLMLRELFVTICPRLTLFKLRLRWRFDIWGYFPMQNKNWANSVWTFLLNPCTSYYYSTVTHLPSDSLLLCSFLRCTYIKLTQTHPGTSCRRAKRNLLFPPVSHIR